MDHIVDEPTALGIASQVVNEANRKLDFKLTKQLQLTEKELREEFNSKIKQLEDGLKKELNYIVI